MKKLIKSIVYPAMRKWRVSAEKRSYSRINIESPNVINQAIIDVLKASQPASIGKMGSSELNIIKDYLQNVPTDSKTWIMHRDYLHVNAGIFPNENGSLREYCKALLEALRDIDVLGVWFNVGESKIAHTVCTKAQVGNFNGLEPFACSDAWSNYLEGKNVLVIHPFKDSIKNQYEKRDLIWGERKLLPDFNLLQIKMPLSNALVPSGFKDWKELLGDIKRQMDDLEYDVAIVGAGAYSLLITQHAKSRGKIGIHLGGATQILFGVCGARWIENTDAIKLFNEHWVRPLPEETPSTNKLVENGCYW